MTKRFLIGSESLRVSDYGAGHPLSIPRAHAALDLIKARGWLDHACYHEAPAADIWTLERVHEPGYVRAVWRAEQTQHVAPEDRQRYNIGTQEQPVRADMFRRAALAAGGSLLAADLLLPAPGGVAFNLIGGAHHAGKGRASGFCYFNDAVLALDRWQQSGLGPLLYIDLDAHHGDGVQEMLAGRPDVMIVSIHRARQHSNLGGMTDVGGGNAINLPVPEDLSDAEHAFLVRTVIEPLARRLKPQGIVVQCGADALAGDPLGGMRLGNTSLWNAVRAIQPFSPRLLLLGGGGYHSGNVARAWAGLWAVATGRDAAALADTPRLGPVRPEIQALADFTNARLAAAGHSRPAPTPPGHKPPSPTAC